LRMPGFEPGPLTFFKQNQIYGRPKY